MLTRFLTICAIAGCVLGTPVRVAAATPIESLRVGDRVSTVGGGSETSVDSSWVRVDLALRHADAPGHSVQLTVLRPAAWLSAMHADEVGAEFELSPDELGVSGVARVVSIRGPPQVADGAGRVVLTTVTRISSDVYELSFEHAAEVLRPTGAHRFYSLGRDQWVSTRDLAVGESIEALGTALVVNRAQPLPGSARVYNIEVETEHEYLVGELGVRTHNACPGAARRELPEHIRERLEAGQNFDAAHRFDTEHNQVGVDLLGGGRGRIDGYTPGEEIVERKFTQLAQVQDDTARVCTR